MPAPEIEKRHGCFFYGCIISLVLLLLVAVVGFLAVRWGANKVNAMIAQYTETVPMDLPREELPADEMTKLRERVATFWTAVQAGTNTPPLVLTAREINALLAGSLEAQNAGFAGKFYIALEGDQATGRMSLPMDKFVRIPLIKTKGQYLNGTGGLRTGVTNSMPFVSIQTLEVKGKPAPEDFMADLRQQNLVEVFYGGRTNLTLLNRFESIQVTNGAVIIRGKGN